MERSSQITVAIAQAVSPRWAAWALIAFGIALAIRSVRRGVTRARRAGRDPERALGIFEAFRGGVIGIGAAVVGWSLLLPSPTLLGLALIIVGEEVLESSAAIAALRAGSRRRRGHDVDSVARSTVAA